MNALEKVRREIAVALGVNPDFYVMACAVLSELWDRNVLTTGRWAQ